jgi:hypothetical protein
MYMIKGEMNLHYLTDEGEEKVAVVREGEIIYCPAGVKHSPRFSPEAFLLGKRGRGEGSLLVLRKVRAALRAVRHVAGYRDDRCRAYEEFSEGSTAPAHAARDGAARTGVRPNTTWSSLGFM